jgi:aspartyl/glutamyl-tRNA(Asn/Gln) amidotransferase C subunit
MVDIENLAALARIKLTPKFKEELEKEFKEILDYFSKLNEIDVRNVRNEEIGNIIGLSNIMREDESENAPGENSEILLKEAPSKEKGFVKVKHILE